MANVSKVLAQLETLDQAQRRVRSMTRRGEATVQREATKRARELADEKVRDAVWTRDGRRCRASGRFLFKAHVDPQQRGEVTHLKARSVAPTLRRALKNLVLLSAYLHKLSDPRTADAGGKALLEIRGTDANKKLVFTLRNLKGHVLWTRASAPPGIER